MQNIVQSDNSTRKLLNDFILTVMKNNIVYIYKIFNYFLSPPPLLLRKQHLFLILCLVELHGTVSGAIGGGGGEGN
jgi:hypothetical protein